jgi:hypothetical protein
MENLAQMFVPYVIMADDNIKDIRQSQSHTRREQALVQKVQHDQI